MRIVFACVVAACCAGCVTTETVQFQASADQQSMVRDGAPALVSTRKGSIVIVRPATRQLQAGGRPVFVVGIYNRTAQPQEFRVANVQVTQLVQGEAVPLKVITYDMLIQEEHNRQIFAAIGTGLAAAGNSYSASRAGYYHSNSTVYTPRGTYNVATTGYSPTAAAIAQSNANAQNQTMINATIEQGRANLANLEHSVIKDDTLMPGEWYGGTLNIQPLVSQSGKKTYTISIVVGSERHEITVMQGGTDA